MPRFIFVLVLVLLWLAHPTFGQTDPSSGQRPLRVGLVLSGGGARGLAHVGVLKKLDEAGVRVDYLGGTSMGSIIGCLYAAGYSGVEMDSILSELDIFATLLSQTGRRERPFYQKQYNERYLLSLSLKNFGIALPSAISGGQGVYDLLSQLTAHVHHIEDFSQLPVPFLAIATDLENGQEVQLESGYLPQIVRASGALPSLLSPVEIDGRLLSDGGIVNNFPVRAVRDKGVDIVIGVDVGEGFYDRTQLKSIPDILGQISTFQSVQSGQQQEKLLDLLIRPELDGFGIADFTATDSIVRLGEIAAEAVLGQLRDIAQRQRTVETYSEPAPVPRRVDTLLVSAFNIVPPRQFTVNTILKQFDSPLTGRIPADRIYRGIDELYATGYFDRIDYRFSPDGRGGLHVEIEPIVKPNFDRRVSLGIHYDDVNETALLVNTTFLNVGLQNSILSFDGVAGFKFRYLFNYFVDNGTKPSFGFQSRLMRQSFDRDLTAPVPLPGGGRLETVQLDLQDWTHQLNLRFFSTDDLAMGVAANAQFFKIETDQFDEFDLQQPFLQTRDWYLTTEFYTLLDFRDERYFPARGFALTGFARAYRPYENAQSNAGINLDVRASLNVLVAAKFSLGANVEAGFNSGTAQNPYRYYLGGNEQNYLNNFRPFLGLEYAEVVSENLLKAQPFALYNLFSAHYLQLSGSFARAGRVLSEAPGQNEANFRSIALTYGNRSPLGPIEVTLAQSNRRFSFYVNLGHWF